MGFHAVTLWQTETFHFLYHMNIIIKTHLNSRTGKMEANDTLREHRGGLLPCGSNAVCVFLLFVVGPLVTSLLVAENN
jgi:hypothetical protein